MRIGNEDECKEDSLTEHSSYKTKTKGVVWVWFQSRKDGKVDPYERTMAAILTES